MQCKQSEPPKQHQRPLHKRKLKKQQAQRQSSGKVILKTMRKVSCNSDTTLYDNFNQIIDFYQPQDDFLKNLDSRKEKELPSIPTGMGLNDDVAFSILINDLLSPEPLTSRTNTDTAFDVIEGEFRIIWEDQPAVNSKLSGPIYQKRWVIVDSDTLKICVSFKNRTVQMELSTKDISDLHKVSHNRFMFKVESREKTFFRSKSSILVLFECPSTIVCERVFDALRASNQPRAQDTIKRKYLLEQQSRFQSFLDQVKKTITFKRSSLV